MKLLYILSEYLPDSGGGIITHYSRMLPQLVRRGHSVRVILASAGKLDQAAYEIDGVVVEPLRSDFLGKYQRRFERFSGLDVYFLLPVAWAAWAQAQESFDYDLVETTDWAMLFAPWVASPKKAPVVVSLHGSCGQVDWYSHTGGGRSLGGDLVRMAEVASLWGADVIHANSRTNAEFWRARTGCEVVVIPPASAGEGSLNRNLTTEDTEATELVQGSFQPPIARIDTDINAEAVLRLASQAGFSESDSLASKLADLPVSESPNRSAFGPASAEALAPGRSALESAADSLADAVHSRSEWSGVFEGPSTSSLVSCPAKTPPAQALGVPALASSFRVIREFRGEKSEGSKHVPCSATVLEARGLVVGRLQNWKGAEVLCQALQLLPEIRVEWLGADTNWDGQGTMVSEYLARNYPEVWGNRLIWLGKVDRSEVAKKIRDAGFLVVPSLWDVFNLTAAEGMEAGVPVVCSRAAGAEMLIEHGKSGFLFESGNAGKLAECIRQVTGMDAATREEMVRQARADVERIMDSNRIVEMLETSYTAAVKKGFSASGDDWTKNFFAPGQKENPPAPAGLLQRAIRKAGRICRVFESLVIRIFLGMNISHFGKRAWGSLNYRGFRALDAIRRAIRVCFPIEPCSRFSEVLKFLPEGDGEYQLYQTYYENCLRELLPFRKTNSAEQFTEHITHVGQYIFRLKDGREIKVAFDAHDHRNIRSKAIHEWCDIYFKSNRWPGIDYGPKVQPISIGNAGITLDNCRYLRGLRGAAKERDLIFVGRIWAGGDANVEHNLRMFESLAKVECKAKLLAVVFAFDKESEEYRMIERRLNKAGVEITDRQISYAELMALSASSKLVVLRAGISGCIAWRMVDMLAMGACLVLDRAPFPEWPVPLVEGSNFLSLGTRITEDCQPAPEEDYIHIPKMVRSFMQNHQHRSRVEANNSEYFDANLANLFMGKFMLKTIFKKFISPPDESRAVEN